MGIYVKIILGKFTK
ncbi:Protein of unknown function [Bacillus mycoides]|nr:Protein of unknown function [Bacillus mycoides]